MNFRHPNHNTSFVGGALRIDARNDAADPLFQFISRPAGSNTESIVAVLTEHGRLAVGGAQFFTPGSNLELNGLGGSEIIFQCSQLPDHGLLVWSEQFMLQNRFGTTGTAVLNDNGSWYVQSDRRLKSDITPATGLLDKALALRAGGILHEVRGPGVHTAQASRFDRPGSTAGPARVGLRRRHVGRWIIPGSAWWPSGRSRSSRRSLPVRNRPLPRSRSRSKL